MTDKTITIVSDLARVDYERFLTMLFNTIARWIDEETSTGTDFAWSFTDENHVRIEIGEPSGQYGTMRTGVSSGRE